MPPYAVSPRTAYDSLNRFWCERLAGRQERFLVLATSKMGQNGVMGLMAARPWLC